jgi:hypothetical protein
MTKLTTGFVLTLATVAHAQPAPEAARSGAATATVPMMTVPSVKTDVVEKKKRKITTKLVDPRSRITPAFELTGNSDGEGTVRIGLDLLLPFENKLDELRVQAAIEAASHDGVTTILSGNSEGFETESSVSGSLDVRYTTLQAAPSILSDAVEVISRAERRQLVRACESPSFKPRSSKGELLDLNVEGQADEVDALELCESGQRALAALDPTNQKALPLPKRQVSFSFSAGRSAFRHLSQVGPEMLAPKSVKKPRFSASIGYVQYAPQERLSVELASTLASSYLTSSRKARWCTSVGAVGGAPADSCSELPLGDPTRSTSLSVAAFLGFVGDDYNWRLAMGPTALLQFGGNEVAYEAGFELPFYLVRASAGFSGVIRVAPAALLTRDAEGDEDTKVLLTLTLLGDRTLFDTASH